MYTYISFILNRTLNISDIKQTTNYIFGHKNTHLASVPMQTLRGYIASMCAPLWKQFGRSGRHHGRTLVLFSSKYNVFLQKSREGVGGREGGQPGASSQSPL